MGEPITRRGRGAVTRARTQSSGIDVATPDALVVRLERAVRRFRLQSAHPLLDEAFAVQRFATSLLELRLLVHARGWERVNGPVTVLARRESSRRSDEPSPTPRPT